MDRPGMSWEDGAALHRRVAERASQEPCRADWRTARDLALIVTATTAGPLAVATLNLGAATAVIWALSVLSGSATAIVLASHVERGGCWVPAFNGASRRRKVALRLIPARHAGNGHRLSVKHSHSSTNTPRAGGGT